MRSKLETFKGSLVARFLFQPIEEVCFQVFGKLLSHTTEENIGGILIFKAIFFGTHIRSGLKWPKRVIQRKGIHATALSRLKYCSEPYLKS